MEKRETTMLGSSNFCGSNGSNLSKRRRFKTTEEKLERESQSEELERESQSEAYGGGGGPLIDTLDQSRIATALTKFK
ncbi:unnamed protein product [Camellia sinensis]